MSERCIEKKNVCGAVVFCLGAVALNLLGAWCIRTFGMPLYLDSMSTLATAFLFGLVPSIFVAVVTNVIMYFIFSAPLIFTTCHIMTAVGAWAVFKFSKRKYSISDEPFPNPIIELFLFAGLLSALSNGVFGSVYSIMLSQTHKETLVEGLSGFLILITNNLPLSHFWSGIVTNLADKTLGTMISFMIVLGVKKVQNETLRQAQGDQGQVQSVRGKISRKSSLKLQPEKTSVFEDCNSVRTSGHSNKSVSQETEVKISGDISDADFKQSSYLTTTILIILATINIISCLVFQKRYRVISGTEQTLESSLYIMILASIILIAACFFILYAKMIQVKKEKELADRQREWQQKLAFDLHDGVLQNLVALNASLESQLQTEETSSQIQFIKSAASELRFLCGILRLNDEVSFEESLHHTIDAYEKTYGFKIKLGIATDLSILNSNQKVELLRILYECLSNTARHSASKNVSITFTDNGSGKLYFTVRDDGKSEKTKAQDSFHGLGLDSIRTRVKNLGGEVEFLQTAEGWTTRVVMMI